MKKMLTIGFGKCIFTLVPLAQWFIIGRLVDARLVNTYFIVYPIQLVYALCAAVFISGANVCAAKEGRAGCVAGGALCCLSIGSVLLGLFAVHADSYLRFLHLDAGLYAGWVRLYVAQQVLYLLFDCVQSYLCFQGREGKSVAYCAVYTSLMVGSLSVGILLWGPRAAARLSFSAMSAVTFFLLRKEIPWGRLSFALHRFASYEVPQCIMSVSLFLVSMANLFRTGAGGMAYVAAMNFAVLITDTQWDSSMSVHESAEIDICGGRFFLGKSVRDAFLYGLLLVSTSLAMGRMLYGGRGLDFRLVCIYFLGEGLMIPIGCMNDAMGAYVNLQVSKKAGGAVQALSQAVRVIMGLAVAGPFCPTVNMVAGIMAKFVALCAFLLYRSRHGGALPGGGAC